MCFALLYKEHHFSGNRPILGISKALVEYKGQNSEYHKTVNTDKVFPLKVTERRNIKWNLSQLY